MNSVETERYICLHYGCCALESKYTSTLPFRCLCIQFTCICVEFKRRSNLFGLLITLTHNCEAGGIILGKQNAGGACCFSQIIHQ